MTFAAFIISFADDELERRAARFVVHNEQLDEWLAHTSIPINIIAMNYREGDRRVDPRITYHDIGPRKTSEARYEAFRIFYESDVEWGIIMDNDATLYRSLQHNSAYGLIAEMSRNLGAYRSLGLFFPLNPAKSPFTKLLADQMHQDNHVFTRNMDLKGSMVFVRNFRAAAEAEVWPDVSYDWCEDGKLAMDAVMLGHSVMRSENIVLRESGLKSSSFGTSTVDRKPFMRAANARMVHEFGFPLCLSNRFPHLLDRRSWLTLVWNGARQLIVPK